MARCRLALATLILMSLIPSLLHAAGDVFPDLRDPPTFHSKDGILAVTLTAAAEDITLGPVTIPGLVFNGVYAGPVLRVHPGDNLLLRIANTLTDPINLHFHGFQGSPLGNADNVHVVIASGESFLYMYRIPKTQPPGVYWFHTHIHGTAERQIMSGLSGTIVVEGFARQFPSLAGIAERLLVMKEYVYDDSEDPVIDGALHERLQTVNGETGVTIRMRPHETQLWHLSNQAPDQAFHLSIPGHGFKIIGDDSVTRTSALDAKVLDIDPAVRIDALVTAGEPGTYDLISEKVLTGTARARVLGHVVVEGDPDDTARPIDAFPPLEDLRRLAVDTYRTVSLTQDAEAGKYFMDGKLFDHDRIDVRVPLGSIQEWILRNDTADFHVFHIHQLHFQVVAINGEPAPFEGYRDTIRIPEEGTVTIRLAFNRPEMVGKFFYHCHVLKHEDKGMMANIEVYDPAITRQGMQLAPFRTWLANVSGIIEGNLPYSFCRLR